MATIQRQLKAAIQAQSLPPPSSTLLTSLTTARNPPPPLPSLLATARTRLLACDLTASDILDVAALSAFPPPPTSSSVSSSGRHYDESAYVAISEMTLTENVYVQVLDVENLSLSRWEQIEQLEAIEKGETRRGREVIRVTAEDEDTYPSTHTQQPQRPQRPGGGETSAGKNATHRLTVQDCKGRRLHALELRRIDALGVGKTNIGEKILLKAGAVIARGTILLTPDNCVMLGGKVDAWHKAWVDGRLQRLKEVAGVE